MSDIEDDDDLENGEEEGKPVEPDDEFRLTGIARLSRDQVRAAMTLGHDEARFLVDAYYTAQEGRKRAHNQVLAMEKSAEPHELISWLFAQNKILEDSIQRALDRYTDAQPVGIWLKSIYGIGPVISAGLIAHIDIDEAPTAGHLWSFAGLNPDAVWAKGEKRPWNAGLKTLCWKVGQSFMKFSGQPGCEYGHLYRERKTREVARNDSGANAQTAALILERKKIGKATDAYKHLMSGKLPPAQVDARARRFVVKLFLSHLQLVWWYLAHEELPPKPYAIEHGGHAHFMPPPSIGMVPGLGEALRKYGAK